MLSDNAPLKYYRDMEEKTMHELDPVRRMRYRRIFFEEPEEPQMVNVARMKELVGGDNIYRRYL